MNTEKITLSCAIDNWANSDVGLVVKDPEPELQSVANCYIMAPGDWFELPVVERINQFWAPNGNGGVQDDKPSQVADGRGWADVADGGIGITNKWINAEAWIAEIIWTDINRPGGIASLITLTSGSGDVPLTVKVESTMPHGNIVIGVKKTGVADYLWSWHLWITDFYPEVGTATLPSGLVVMDRDLGAINVNGGQDAGSMGLYYQWGRKDPFLLHKDFTTLDKKSYYDGVGGDLGNFIVNTNGSLDGSIKNQRTFYGQGSSSRDWIVDGALAGGEGMNRWGGNVSHTDATASDDNEKTIYDPCPHGWRVMRTINGNGPMSGLSLTDFTNNFSDGNMTASGIGLRLALGRLVIYNGVFVNWSSGRAWLWLASSSSVGRGNIFVGGWENGVGAFEAFTAESMPMGAAVRACKDV